MPGTSGVKGFVVKQVILLPSHGLGSQKRKWDKSGHKLGGLLMVSIENIRDKLFLDKMAELGTKWPVFLSEYPLAFDFPIRKCSN